MTTIYGTNGTIIPNTDEMLEEMFSTAYRMSRCIDCGTGFQWNQTYEDLNAKLASGDETWDDGDDFWRRENGLCIDCESIEQAGYEEYRRTKYDGIIPIEWLIGEWKIPFAIGPWIGE